MKAQVIKTTGMWYGVRSQDGQRYTARLRGKFRLEGKKITNPIAVGDYVMIVPNEKGEGDWIISDILPRENYVARESPKRKSFTHLVAANVDQALVLFTFHTPRTSIVFIDRFLVTLEAYRIPGLVVLNKCDLLTTKELDQWYLFGAVYEQLGYATFMEAFANRPPSQALRAALTERNTLLAGHSGTGKSTLINALVQEAAQEVGDISGFANKGRHTTTFAEMFDVDSQSHLIDTPGIKELGLAEVESQELAHYFPEMRDLMGACQFHNCSHSNEPGCAVKAAMAAGDIAEFRYASYLNMLTSTH